MDLRPIWRSERLWVWTIFIILGIVAVLTPVWFRSYHKIHVDDVFENLEITVQI